MLKTYIQLSEDSVPMTYTSQTGQVYEQGLGKYNPKLYKAIATDLFYFYCMQWNRGTDYAEIVKTWADRLEKLNKSICTMCEEYSNQQPISEFDFEDAIALMREFLYLKEKGGFLNEKIKKQIISWCTALPYMQTYAYYVCQLQEIKEQSDLSKDNEDVNALLKLRTLMLRLFMRIPVTSKEHKELLDRLELIRIMIVTKLNGTEDELLKIFEKSTI